MVEWYQKDAFYQAIRKFHDDFARQPDMSPANDAKATHDKFVKEIEEKLREAKICKKLEFKGSSYEGVKVTKSPSDPDLEFDIVVVMPGGEKLDEILDNDHPGFARLVTKGQGQKTSTTSQAAAATVPSFFKEGEQMPGEISNKFFGELQKIINKSPSMKDRVKLVRHGPSATQMDVFADATKSGSPLYSVDWVPCYEVNGKLYLVKDKIIAEGRPEISWRQCFSLQEKAKLNGMDRDNGCRKQVLRVLKVIRNASPELQALSSFHFKMALFFVVDEVSDGSDWNCKKLGERVIDVLKKLETFLKNGSMPLYTYLPNANILMHLSPKTISNLQDRVHKLSSSETRLTKLMDNVGKTARL